MSLVHKQPIQFSALSWQVLCQSDIKHKKSGKRDSQLKHLHKDLSAGKTVVYFLNEWLMGQRTLSGAISRQVIPGAIRKQAEQAIREQAIRQHPSSASPSVLASMCLLWCPLVMDSDVELWAEINSSSPSHFFFFLSQCFITAIELLRHTLLLPVSQSTSIFLTIHPWMAFLIKLIPTNLPSYNNVCPC